MKEFNTEVLVVGSGLVGLVAAHCLSNLDYNVTLVDKKNFISAKSSLREFFELIKFFLSTKVTL